MIGIVDYGMGNLFSVDKALERIGVPHFISSKREELESADGLILPGVGSFKDAMHILKETGLAAFLDGYVQSGKPLLGICLGMQLLFEESEENGFSKGLGYLPGTVKEIPSRNEAGEAFKVPHMGWNQLIFKRDSQLLEGLEEENVYFVHSYFVDGIDENDLIASAQYSVMVPAVVEKDNVYGMQFHPEKSSRLGMALLKNFTELVLEKESQS
ncbi:imidazole glycerol phosphate synthase subunit HisH [Falsibacillus pallidus]|uniref:Imidazole glycerol phosphate synthase subunit HisH n=1 Tax=Falsibacillus pallidus TaxID=493781 RepID=A0A370GBF0_9BACI|nr:imidazole glycerol phosphate synthase subunit HisH [Falsibacillus pallidus]RDI41051.1 glutamine amidotransferase [Falsibacillus pallidus]